MKSRRYETAGVHLGWAISTGDGFIFRNDDGIVEWSWGYITDPAGHTVTDPRGWLAEHSGAQQRFERRIAQ